MKLVNLFLHYLARGVGSGMGWGVGLVAVLHAAKAMGFLHD